MEFAKNKIYKPEIQVNLLYLKELLYGSSRCKRYYFISCCSHYFIISYSVVISTSSTYTRTLFSLYTLIYTQYSYEYTRICTVVRDYSTDKNFYTV